MQRLSTVTSVYARDPDTILTMTRHTEEGAFTVDAILRNCPPMSPFAIRWDYPLIVQAPELDPADLKRVKPGGKAWPISPLAIINELPEGAGAGWKTTKWQEHCEENLKIPQRTFYNLLAEAKAKHGAKFHSTRRHNLCSGVA
jgi:hypothetical protein